MGASRSGSDAVSSDGQRLLLLCVHEAQHREARGGPADSPPRGHAERGTSEDSEADAKPKVIALYHDMRVEEDFAKCATRIFTILKKAAATSPGAPRYLYLDVQGHRNAAGGYDADALEIIKEFLTGFLSPYLTEISTPLYQARNPKPQREDIPDVLNIRDPDREHAFDHRELRVRNRDSHPDERRSRPPVRAIAEYLGLDEPICLICWQAPVERAHVVPESLGGSNDVRNFALLCPRHHREAPDVVDAEAFWSWVDYACERDGHMKWQGVEPEMVTRAESVGIHIDTRGPVRKSLHHFGRVRGELVRHYGWCPEVLHRWRPLGSAEGRVPHGDGRGDQHTLQRRQEGIHRGMGLRGRPQAPERRGPGRRDGR
ncbi:HNH endonuclease [Streptomyces sp. NPDC058011]|uniref:HNH endonuclease n=1 Tax=Streptomyces sp. NPDC058011 TaxID=3346305 RepID=UPI0036E60BD8